ncbi:nuclear pore glycoprotein p62 [Dasypus novemcinctus]|uniref:nuclear pore glycoprotein p62 n=1 Tax=Dasypus novemcinctus TaxID=9361 RepID=UPI00265FF5DD|nr:nuclear pore glycoprotein p62 [Dasypus novemcinctus]
MSGFNFGGAGAPTGGFTFGTAKTATTTASTGFSFSTTGTGGFNFGIPSQPTTSTPPSSLFSLTTQAPATQAPGFSFGSAAPAASGTGFSLGMSAPKLSLSSTATTQAALNPGGLGGSSLPGATPSTAASGQGTAPTGFVFSTSTTSAAPSTTAGSFSLTGGGTAQTGSSGFSAGSMGTSGQPPALAGLPFTLTTPAATGAGTTQPATTTATATSAGSTLFSSIATAPASSAATSLSLCAPAATTGTPAGAALGFSLKAPGAASSTASTASTTSSTTTTTSFALNLKPLAPIGISGGAAATITAPPPGPSAAAVAPASPAMTYAQLESLINKWSLELEDQERHFLQQATQVNAWDRTLIENGEKITTLHREVEKVKLDQRRLDQELDFILSQQKELEDLLSPLEESVKEQSGTIYLQHADEEREKTYKLAENIDAQLKRMAQDLKDVIEHLNTCGGPADTSDPLQQICKILNAHMDSLQWVDQNSALLQRKVEEVTRVCEGRRKEQERGFRIAFD